MKAIVITVFLVVATTAVTGAGSRVGFVGHMTNFVLTRAKRRDQTRFKRMPDFTPPVVDDLRRDEHGNCLSDVLPCWDGTSVKRREELDCHFDKCTARKVIIPREMREDT